MKFPILIPNIFNYPFTYESDVDLKIGDFVVAENGKISDSYDENKLISSFFHTSAYSQSL